MTQTRNLAFHACNLIQTSSSAANRTANLIDADMRQRVVARTNLSKIIPFDTVADMIKNLKDDKVEADLRAFCIR